MDWAALLLYITVSMITPGPNNLMSLCLAAQYGVYGMRRFLIGSTLALAVKMLLCGALNLALASVVPALVPYLKWLGAGYMLYLGYSMLRAGFAAGAEQESAGGRATYGTGVLLQCLNIKSWVFALSVFSSFVIPHTTSVGAVALVSLVSVVLMVASSLAWALFGSAFRRVYTAHRKAFGVVMALSLAACAVTAVR